MASHLQQCHEDMAIQDETEGVHEAQSFGVGRQHWSERDATARAVISVVIHLLNK